MSGIEDEWDKEAPLEPEPAAESATPTSPPEPDASESEPESDATASEPELKQVERPAPEPPRQVPKSDVRLPVDSFDWLNPQYSPVFAVRAERLKRLREKPDLIGPLKKYYADNIAQFIIDWGCTADPRNVNDGLPAVIPFILFPRQVEFVDWVLDSWKNDRPGAMPKSRESGASWLAIATAASLAVLRDGVVAGFGSRKAEYVDKIGDPKSLFWKARKFIEMLPVEFRAGYSPSDTAVMRIPIKETGSVLTGEGGDNIGRGDRTSLYFVDEAAFLEHPVLAEASLSQTTRCRIDISTANGLGNPFHRKVTTWPEDRVFRFHWRDDPRKDEAWYEKQKAELDPVTVAQEIDIDFAASVEGVLIPSAWVQAAVGAHSKLFISPHGPRTGALDVADEGKDKLAFVGGQGVLVDYLEEWSGKGDDIFGSVEKTFGLCDEHEYESFRYDGDGLGAGVRGDARIINERRKKAGERQLTVTMFRGSAGVAFPERQDVKGRKNIDYFSNAKAQGWWALRKRFQVTFRAVTEGLPFDPDEIISLDPALPGLQLLCAELSQPTYSLNGVGKIAVNKAPDGTKSPNKADAVMIRFAPMSKVIAVSDDALVRASIPGAARMPAAPNAQPGAKPRLQISDQLLMRSRGRF